MTKSDGEWAEWARQNRVAFEVSPLVESRGAEKIHVGFALSLYGALPMDKTAGPERQEAGVRLLQEMRAFVDAIVSSEKGVARTEWEPARMAAVLRPENELRPEVSLTLRIFHADEYLKAVTADERERLEGFLKRLTGLGLRQGHW